MIGFIGLFDKAHVYNLQLTITHTRTHAYTCPQSRLHCCCFVAAFNGGCSPSSVFPKCSWPQLPDFNSNSSQWLNPGSSLTNCNSMSKSKSCYDRRSVGQCVLVSSPQLGSKTRFLLLSHSCGFVDVERPLWRQDGSVVYNWCWSSPAQSFSCPSPAGLMIILYSLRFETTPPQPGGPSPRIDNPQEEGGSFLIPSTRFTFLRLLRLSGLRRCYSNLLQAGYGSS
jgi:hypothetical protein